MIYRKPKALPPPISVLFLAAAEIVTEWDTFRSETIPFELAGNSLNLFNPGPDTVESGAVTK